MAVVSVLRPELPRLQPFRLLRRNWSTTAAMRLHSTLVSSPWRLRSKAMLLVTIFWGLVFMVFMVLTKGNGG